MANFVSNASFPAGNTAPGIAAINSPRISLGCINLDNWLFENFTLGDEPFVKGLKIFETCVS